MSSYDVVVVGGGPSGLAAAAAASESGLRVALVDASAQIGGQYWRRPSDQEGAKSPGATFESLRRCLIDVDHHPEHQAWLFEPATGDHRLHLAPTHDSVRTEAPPVLRARSLILCPGAYDRQLPIPGWDLPGVMAAGGVQALVKAHGSLPGRRAVVAGTGPFLLPVARQLAEAGAEVVVCDANGLTGWLRTPLDALAVPSKMAEAASYAAAFARHRIPFRARTIVAAIEGSEKVDSVRLRKVDRAGNPTGRGETINGVDLVALGWGFTPSLELVLAAGAATRVDLDESLVAVVDAWQRTDVAGVYAAGEATGVGGALLALAEGEIAGLAAARDHGRPVDRRRAERLQRQVRRGRAFAAAMHRAHPVPAGWQDWLEPDTTVCRCEEVTVQDIRDACQDLGAVDARTAKLLARPGMGWCQGRVCGFASAKLTQDNGKPLCGNDLAPMSQRSIAMPVSLERLASDDLTRMGPDEEGDG
ncbi:FAD/NAD(P)-dependent oxidoreductase [Amycolatopsis silviterrae]|uniref:NAD(P)/FAD-dependent oxidoreductase n=1 Tax=Amycolatopsis silviterrae TaxID=1656914 RepID=A0ABW5HLW1_9PSEU